MECAVKIEADSPTSVFMRAVADEAATMVAEQLSVSGLQGYTLLIESSAQAVYSVSPRGLAAYLRAHADLIDNSTGPKRQKAYRDLEKALRRIWSDFSAFSEARGRRPS